MIDLIIFLLAGGRSTRYKNFPIFYSQDKLLSVKKNMTLIECVIKEVKSLAPVYIITRDDSSYSTYSRLFLKENKIKVFKEKLDHAIGPLGGIFYAMEHFPSILTKIFIPADLPFITRSVVENFVKKISILDTFDLISIVHQNGQSENLFLTINNSLVLRDIEFLMKNGNFRVSSLIRLVKKKYFINSSSLSSKKEIWREFTDKDTIKTKLNNKPYYKNKIIMNSDLIFGDNPDPSIFFQKYLDLKNKNPILDNEKDVEQAKQLLVKEADIYKNKGLLSISLHCLFDAYNIDKDPQIKGKIRELLNILDG